MTRDHLWEASLYYRLPIGVGEQGLNTNPIRVDSSFLKEAYTRLEKFNDYELRTSGVFVNYNVDFIEPILEGKAGLFSILTLVSRSKKSKHFKRGLMEVLDDVPFYPEYIGFLPGDIGRHEYSACVMAAEHVLAKHKKGIKRGIRPVRELQRVTLLDQKGIPHTTVVPRSIIKPIVPL